MQQLAFMSLERVEGDIIFDSNCEQLYTGFWWNLATNLTYVGGDLKIINNDHLNGLGGFEKIQHIGGEVLIKNNAANIGGIPRETITGQTGFDLVQEWITKGYVSAENVECYLAGSETPIVFN